jgi:hypothetical protein
LKKKCSNSTHGAAAGNRKGRGEKAEKGKGKAKAVENRVTVEVPRLAVMSATGKRGRPARGSTSKRRVEETETEEEEEEEEEEAESVVEVRPRKRARQSETREPDTLALLAEARERTEEVSAQLASLNRQLGEMAADHTRQLGELTAQYTQRLIWFNNQYQQVQHNQDAMHAFLALIERDLKKK